MSSPNFGPKLEVFTENAEVFTIAALCHCFLSGFDHRERHTHHTAAVDSLRANTLGGFKNLTPGLCSTRTRLPPPRTPTPHTVPSSSLAPGISDHTRAAELTKGVAIKPPVLQRGQQLKQRNQLCRAAHREAQLVRARPPAIESKHEGVRWGSRVAPRQRRLRRRATHGGLSTPTPVQPRRHRLAQSQRCKSQKAIQ